MSSTTCPVFRPSLEEFCNFSKYIDRVERNVGDAGICKVIPPDGWCRNKTAKEVEAVWERLNIMIPPIKQCVSGLRGVYQLGLLEAKKMSVSEFRELAAKTDSDPSMSMEEVERAFWRSMGPMAAAPLYGADLMGSLFEDDPASGWNLSKLDNMIKLLPSDLPGITTAMLYFGMWRAMFAFHTEDMNLYSINYLHTGRPKSWYSIPPNQAKRFESMAQSLHPQGFQGCTEYLRHKTTMFSPKVLKDYGIPFHTVVQHPGEFVITFPASYHAGFNHGFNCAEATNFTTERWIPKGFEAKVCRCQPYSVHINMNDFAAKLAAKKEHDLEMTQVVSSQAKRKKMLTRLAYTGWLEWQSKVEKEDKAEETKAKVERAKLLEERRKAKEKLRKEELFQQYKMGLKRKLDDGSSSNGAGNASLMGSSLLAWEDDDDAIIDWQSTAWEFRCHCGVSCSNTDPEEMWPKGAMFQCAGCDMWCHTQCIYSSDQPPEDQPFCHVCLGLMLKIQGGDAVKREGAAYPSLAPQVFHTGRQIRAKSRVLVCGSVYGLSEGHVKDTGEGKARVYYKSRIRGPNGGAEEWVSLTSPRFLTNDQVMRALHLMKPLRPITEKDAIVFITSNGNGTYQQHNGYSEYGKKHHKTSHSRGLPLPTGSAAVSYAKFMKDRYRYNKHVQRAMLAPGGHGPAPGTYYPRFAKPGQIFSYHSEDEGDEEEEEEIFQSWHRHRQRQGIGAADEAPKEEPATSDGGSTTISASSSSSDGRSAPQKTPAPAPPASPARPTTTTAGRHSYPSVVMPHHPSYYAPPVQATTASSTSSSVTIKSEFPAPYHYPHHSAGAGPYHHHQQQQHLNRYALAASASSSSWAPPPHPGYHAGGGIMAFSAASQQSVMQKHRSAGAAGWAPSSYAYPYYSYQHPYSASSATSRPAVPGTPPPTTAQSGTTTTTTSGNEEEEDKKVVADPTTPTAVASSSSTAEEGATAEESSSSSNQAKKKKEGVDVPLNKSDISEDLSNIKLYEQHAQQEKERQQQYAAAYQRQYQYPPGYQYPYYYQYPYAVPQWRPVM